MSRKKFLIPILIIFCSSNIYADINVGFNLCNNQLNDQWVMTFSPEVSLSGRWYWIGVDGNFIGYKPSDRIGNHIIHTRISVVPMLRAQLGHFFTTIGYGLSDTYQREEIEVANGFYTIDSEDKLSGEFRCNLGVAIPLSQKLKLLLKGGYAYIHQNHQYVLFSMGCGFGYPQSTQMAKRPSDRHTIAEKTPPKSTFTIQKITILESNDRVINELNRALEVALIKEKIQTVSFEKIIDSVNASMIHTTDTEVPISSDDSETDLENMKKINIAFKGAVLLNVDGIVETKMRYYYRSYGGDVIVNTAYIRILSPKTGDIIWANEYTIPESTFDQCKKKLSSELIEAIKQR